MNRICITIPIEHNEMNTPVKDLASLQGWTKFNPTHAHIMAALYNWMTFSVELFLVHPEFPEHVPGSECMRFFLDDARRTFPYLFADTNPIRYRKFTTPPNGRPYY